MQENENPVLSFTLHLSEVGDIIKTLGELPTKSNAYPLMMNLKTQAEAQLNKPNEESNTESV